MLSSIIIVIIMRSAKRERGARIFLGIDIPENIRKKIREAMNYYDKYLERVVPEENWHITLLFLGNVDRYSYYLSRIANDLRCPFLLTVSMLYLGRGLKGSQLWAYVEKNNSLINARKELGERVKKARMPVSVDLPKIQEGNNFVPHVRVGDMLKTTQGRGIADRPVAGTFAPKTVNIYRSELVDGLPKYFIEHKINVVS